MATITDAGYRSPPIRKSIPSGSAATMTASCAGSGRMERLGIAGGGRAPQETISAVERCKHTRERRPGHFSSGLREGLAL